MRLSINHTTSYKYEKEVFLEPHHLYFHPETRNYLKVESFEMKVSPTPSGLAFRLDAENNPYHQVWFNEPHHELTIEVHMIVECTPFNPFNFLLEEHPKLDHTEALLPYMKTVEFSYNSWVDEIKHTCGPDIITFLTFLTKELKAAWTYEARHEPVMVSPDTCFEKKSGSCRELSWMMVQMLRHQQIPARFVSGYAFNPNLTAGHELHAWVEAWIPGAGWIGLDPSAGLWTSEIYVPVACSYNPRNTYPVQGSYRGTGSAELKFEVRIGEA